MRVILNSADGELYKLCRDILNEFHGLAWNLVISTPPTTTAGADLYIWDGQTEIDLPRELDERFSRHLFLLNRDDVSKLHQNLGSAEAAILLKPVTRACLSAFLGMAVSSFHDRLSTADSLRLDRDEILQCLIQANLELQEYDQARTNFLARAVHDFRAPLTAANGYCGLLLSEALGSLNQEQQRVLRRMQQSIRRLSRMPSAMFEMSVGKYLKKPPDLRPGIISACVEQALHEVTPFIEDKRISVSVDMAAELGTVFMEHGQIEQVIINLLDNACKFAPTGGEIGIQGYPSFWERRSSRPGSAPALERRRAHSGKPNSYRVDIRDSGPQIPREDLEKIFEESTPYAGRDRSGGGLGLAISRMITQTHEGKVWAENTEYGPQFCLVLPVRSSGQPEIADRSRPELSHTEAR
jgi:signal transduction histidine kinase